jgi:hypothetical protein
VEGGLKFVVINQSQFKKGIQQSLWCGELAVDPDSISQLNMINDTIFDQQGWYGTNLDFRSGFYV